MSRALESREILAGLSMRSLIEVVRLHLEGKSFPYHLRCWTSDSGEIGRIYLTDPIVSDEEKLRFRNQRSYASKKVRKPGERGYLQILNGSVSADAFVVIHRKYEERDQLLNEARIALREAAKNPTS